MLLIDKNKAVIDPKGFLSYQYVFYEEELLLGLAPLNTPTKELAILYVAYDMLLNNDESWQGLHNTIYNKVIYLNFFLDSEKEQQHFKFMKEGKYD